MRQLIAIRHGESTANVLFRQADAPPVLPGRDADIPLSPRGRTQAAGLGPQVAVWGPDVVVCSPYVRARQTWGLMASAAAEHGYVAPAARVDRRLRDREMGVLELHTPAAVPDWAAVHEWDYRPPYGESMDDVVDRVGAFLDELGSGTTLVVAHDATIVAAHHIFSGGAPLPGVVDNVSVTRWEWRDGAVRLAEFATVLSGPPPDGPSRG